MDWYVPALGALRKQRASLYIEVYMEFSHFASHYHLIQ